MKTWCCAYLVSAWWCMAVEGDCDVAIGDSNYTEETLASHVGLAQGMAVDFNTHYLYFSFYNATQGLVRNAKVDIKSKTISFIEELSGYCLYTVDQVRGYVHAGCGTEHDDPGGLYQWDSNSGRFELAGETGHNVQFIHYHNNTLYYSVDEKLLLHTFINGHSAVLSTPASKMWCFIIDARGLYIFTNSTGLYRWWGSDAKEERFPDYGSWLFALAVDGHGAAYTCDSNNRRGVWRLHNDTPNATRLLDVPCTALAFDGDSNMIYADIDRRSIVRLVPC